MVQRSLAHLSILQISDLHILPIPDATLLGVNTAHYFHSILQLAFSQKLHFDLILLTGDLAQDPCPTSYEYILNSIESYDTPCICLPGNHDDYELMQQVLNTPLISCRKQIFLENWQLLSLNSQIIDADGGRLAKSELRFLENCLVKYPNYHTLIAVHHHCIPTRSAWMDTMKIKNSREFFALLREHPQVKIITTGHIHQELDAMVDNIKILGTPSTCFQFKPHSKEFALDSNAPGYRVLQLYPNGDISTQVERLANQLDELQLDTLGY